MTAPQVRPPSGNWADADQNTINAADIRARAEDWYARQIRTIAEAHGDSWTEHREWIEDYLREELRQRLHALGWRAKA